MLLPHWVDHDFAFTRITGSPAITTSSFQVSQVHGHRLLKGCMQLQPGRILTMVRRVHHLASSRSYQVANITKISTESADIVFALS